MKKVQKIILMVVGIAMLISCNTNQKQSNIILNNGNKWEVNKEMKPYLENEKELLNTFIEEKDHDYKKLAKNLKTQNNTMISSCTMEGKSHMELHKWLHPHMELIENLSNAHNFNEAKDIVSDIEKSFDTYQTYFK